MKSLAFLLSIMSFEASALCSRELLNEACQNIKGEEYGQVVYDCQINFGELEEAKLCIKNGAQLILEEREKCLQDPNYYFETKSKVPSPEQQVQQQVQNRQRKPEQQQQMRQQQPGQTQELQQQQQKIQQQRQQRQQRQMLQQQCPAGMVADKYTTIVSDPGGNIVSTNIQYYCSKVERKK